MIVWPELRAAWQTQSTLRLTFKVSLIYYPPTPAIAAASLFVESYHTMSLENNCRNSLVLGLASAYWHLRYSNVFHTFPVIWIWVGVPLHVGKLVNVCLYPICISLSLYIYIYIHGYIYAYVYSFVYTYIWMCLSLATCGFRMSEGLRRYAEFLRYIGTIQR